MSNRFMNQFHFSFVKGKTSLYGRVTFGATGAPTLDSVKSKGIKSIVRNSAGNYTIALQDNYYAFLRAAHVFVGSSAPAAPSMYVTSESVSSTTPSLIVQFNAAGTATDPASGEEVRLELVLNNSSAQ